MDIRNLVLLGGSFEKCKEKIFKNDMELFKKNKLKTRANKIVTNKKQALAIALSQTQSQCLSEMNTEETNKLIDKVDRNLNEKDKELILTNLVETKDAIELLNNMGKTKRIYIFKKLLWDKIIDEHRKGKQLDKNMWDMILEIHKL